MPPPEKTVTRAKPRARSNDTSRWPLLVIKFDGDATDEEYAASLAERTLLLFHRQKYCVLLDGTTCGARPASQRKLEADWTREHHALLAQVLVGIVFVCPVPRSSAPRSPRSCGYSPSRGSTPSYPPWPWPRSGQVAVCGPSACAPDPDWPGRRRAKS